MSEPLGIAPPPPAYLEAFRSHGGKGSIGPVIAVLAVIAVLGVIAGIVGRLCSGRSVMGYGHYDLESWIERKCGSCIDGTLEASTAPPPPAVVQRPSSNDNAAAAATQLPQEANSRGARLAREVEF